MKRILVFGAGEAGRSLIKAISADVDIIGVIDNDPSKHGTTLEGIEVIGPDLIKSQDYDCIVIASMYELEIIDQLIAMGIRPSNLCADIEERIKCQGLKGVEYYYPISIISILDGYADVNCGKDLDAFLLNSRDCRDSYAAHYIDNEHEVSELENESRLLKELYINRKIDLSGNSHLQASVRNRNLINRIRTPYTLNMPPGDIVMPEFLERAEALIEENPGVGVIFANRVYVDALGRYLGVYRSKDPVHEGRVIAGDEFVEQHIATAVPLLFASHAAVVNVELLKREDKSGLLASSLDTVALIWAMGIKHGALYLDMLGGISKKPSIVPDEMGRLPDAEMYSSARNETLAVLRDVDFIDPLMRDKTIALVQKGS